MSEIRAKSTTISELPALSPLEGMEVRRFFGERAMLQHVTLTKGVSAPPHKHEMEQIITVLSGRFRLDICDGPGGEMRSVEIEPGGVIHLPSWVPHGGEALEDTVALDVFSPPSETTGVDS